MVRMLSRALGPKAKMEKLGPCRALNILLILAIFIQSTLDSKTVMASEFNNPLSISPLIADPYRVKFPNKREYTYVPSDITKKNRSRLDFFVVSRDILSSVSECSILPGLQNKLFDHHAIILEFNARKKIITPPTISKHVMKDPETELVGGLAAAESYVLYSSILLPAD
jgi:hypothetical protein